jgi:hypothetical protein
MRLATATTATSEPIRDVRIRISSSLMLGRAQ